MQHGCEIRVPNEPKSSLAGAAPTWRTRHAQLGLVARMAGHRQREWRRIEGWREHVKAIGMAHHIVESGVPIS